MDNYSNSVKKAFEDNGIVPDVLSSGTGLSKCVKVNYNTGNGSAPVELGNQLTPTQTSQQPQVDWDARADRVYTLAMVDPDAPSRANPTIRAWLHWLVVNIPGQQVGQGQIVSPYMGPAPPVDTDLHRYVFLVYDQRGSKLNLGDQQITDMARGNFSIENFAKQQKLGRPMAGNFFLSEYEGLNSTGI